MGTTLTLDDRRFKAAAKKARELGKTPETFIESLIDAATLTFDEILAPVRKGFKASGVTEEELDELSQKPARRFIGNRGGSPGNDSAPRSAARRVRLQRIDTGDRQRFRPRRPGI